MNTPMVETIRAKIEAVHRRKHVLLSDGTRKQITGAVRTDEAARMAALILERQYRSTLETGVASVSRPWPSAWPWTPSKRRRFITGSTPSNGRYTRERPSRCTTSTGSKRR